MILDHVNRNSTFLGQELWPNLPTIPGGCVEDENPGEAAPGAQGASRGGEIILNILEVKMLGDVNNL